MSLCKLKVIQSDNNQMSWIEDIAIGLTDVYKLRSPYDLCKHLCISIKRLGHNSPVLHNKSSVYFRNYNGEEVIFIRDDLFGYNEERILRHQLGHAILHPNMNDSLTHHSIKLNDEANYFGEILKEVKIDILRRIVYHAN